VLIVYIYCYISIVHTVYTYDTNCNTFHLHLSTSQRLRYIFRQFIDTVRTCWLINLIVSSIHAHRCICMYHINTSVLKYTNKCMYLFMYHVNTNIFKYTNKCLHLCMYHINTRILKYTNVCILLKLIRLYVDTTMALGSTKPVTEMSTRNISCGKGCRCVGLTTLSTSCADCLKIW
jgi:hypothetical protein